MREVLVSIKPKYCQLISNGAKTIEVRKTYPREKAPFKAYIYCTKGEDGVNDLLEIHDSTGKIRVGNGKVIGEFVCDLICNVLAHPPQFAGHPLFFRTAIEDACISYAQAQDYSGGKDLYGWHISNLVIYDDPKDLSEFRHCGANYHFDPVVTRPPQSWCYVERANNCGAKMGGEEDSDA